jgi:hypothetical protein
LRVDLARFEVSSDLAARFFFIGLLPAEWNRLGLLAVELDAQSFARSRDRQVAVAEAPDQVEGLALRPLERAAERVVLDGALDRVAYLRRRPEEAVSRHQATQRLVWPLEIVAVDEEREPPQAIGEVGEDRAAQKLLPQRLPEALHLAQRLRVMGPALDVLDALLPQRLLEGGLAPPRRVLPAVVRQHFPRRPVRGDAPLESLHHELASLVVRQRVPDDEARVVVHEDRQVQPLVAPQEEGEDVRLPELIRLRSLPAPLRPLALRRRHGRLDEPLLVQQPADLVLAHPERLEAPEHVAYPTRSVLRMLVLERDHRLALALRLRSATLDRRVPPRRLRHERVHAPALVSLHPALDGLLRDAEEP